MSYWNCVMIAALFWQIPCLIGYFKVAEEHEGVWPLLAGITAHTMFSVTSGAFLYFAIPEAWRG